MPHKLFIKILTLLRTPRVQSTSHLCHQQIAHTHQNTPCITYIRAEIGWRYKIVEFCAPMGVTVGMYDNVVYYVGL